MKIQVTVKPRSKQQKILELEDGSLMVQLKSSTVKGETNQELIKALAKRYRVTQSQVTVKHGLSSR